MAIITVLLALAVPATNSLLRGNDLTTGAQNLTNLLGLARQQALTQNRPIEFRLYKFADPSNGENLADPATWKFRAIQIFAIPEASGAIPIGTDEFTTVDPTTGQSLTLPPPIPLDKIQRFPPTFIIDSGKVLSPMIPTSSTGGTGTATATSPGIVLTEHPSRVLPQVEKNYQSVAFRFYPDGSMSLGAPPTGGGWYFTAHQLAVGDNLAGAPANFATFQLDPYNGSAREFRP